MSLLVVLVLLVTAARPGVNIRVVFVELVVTIAGATWFMLSQTKQVWVELLTIDQV